MATQKIAPIDQTVCFNCGVKLTSELGHWHSTGFEISGRHELGVLLICCPCASAEGYICKAKEGGK